MLASWMLYLRSEKKQQNISFGRKQKKASALAAGSKQRAKHAVVPKVCSVVATLAATVLSWFDIMWFSFALTASKYIM